MSGMLRFKDEKDFEALLKRSNVRIHSNGVTRVITRSAPVVKPPKVGSELEELFSGQLRSCGNLPPPDLVDQPYLIGRAHRIDFGWSSLRLGVEVQGMAHRVKERFLADLEKRALGQLQGWTVLEVGGEHIRNGKAMEWFQELYRIIKNKG